MMHRVLLSASAVLALAVSLDLRAAEAICARPGNLLCEDFESYALGCAGFQSECPQYGGGAVESPVLVPGSTRTLELMVKPGARDSIYPALGPFRESRRVRMRWWADWEPGHVFNTITNKFIYIMKFENDEPVFRGLALELRRARNPRTAEIYVQLYVDTGTTDYDCDRRPPPGGCVNGGEGHLTTNVGKRWTVTGDDPPSCFEVLVTLGPNGSSFEDSFEVWIDSVQRMRYNRISLRNKNSAHGFTHVWPTAYYGGQGETAPSTLRTWIDNIVVDDGSQGEIGCGVAPNQDDRGVK